MASPVPPASSWSPMPPSPASPSCRSTLYSGLMGGLCVGAVAAVVLFTCCGEKNRQSRESTPGGPTPGGPTPGAPQTFGIRGFTLNQVEGFTKKFSKEIGSGGFGHVYEGSLPNGEGGPKKVAVKRLKEESKQGEREFKTEIENLSRAHHKHVMSLVGYCIAKTERILVYEYVPNNTLDFHLHGHGAGRRDFNWPERLKIALGSAKGLAYLHEGCHPNIIHRDIKSANILLDRNFEAKIADFGLAKCISESKTHVITDVKGTPGYLDPEYMLDKILTEKTDVYSFGVVLWELITGRGPIGLVASVRSMFKRCEKDQNFETLADDKLQNQELPKIDSVVKLAMACVDKKPDNRPKMSKIVRHLEDIVEDCPNRMAGRSPGHVASTSAPAPAKKGGS